MHSSSQPTARPWQKKLHEWVCRKETQEEDDSVGNSISTGSKTCLSRSLSKSFCACARQQAPSQAPEDGLQLSAQHLGRSVMHVGLGYKRTILPTNKQTLEHRL
jgi:hypothetical protein